MNISKFTAMCAMPNAQSMMKHNKKAARLFTKFVVRVCGCEQRKIDIDIIQRSDIHQQPPHDKMAVYYERENE